MPGGLPSSSACLVPGQSLGEVWSSGNSAWAWLMLRGLQATCRAACLETGDLRLCEDCPVDAASEGRTRYPGYLGRTLIFPLGSVLSTDTEFVYLYE